MSTGWRRNSNRQACRHGSIARTSARATTAIRQAIQDGGYFVACFSTASAKRRSFMLDELEVALDRLRHDPPQGPWLIPVRLDDCVIIGPTEDYDLMLRALQWIDLFTDWNDGVRRLLETMGPGPDDLVSLLEAPWFDGHTLKALANGVNSTRNARFGQTVDLVAVVGPSISADWRKQVASAIETLSPDFPQLASRADDPAEVERAMDQMVRSGKHQITESLDRLSSQADLGEDVRALAALPLSLVLFAGFNDVLISAFREAGKAPKRYSPDTRNYEPGSPGREPNRVEPIDDVASPVIYHLFGHLSEPDNVLLDLEADAAQRCLLSIPTDLLNSLINARTALLVGFNSHERALERVLPLFTRSSRLQKFTSSWIRATRHEPSRVGFLVRNSLEPWGGTSHAATSSSRAWRSRPCGATRNAFHRSSVNC